MKKVLGLDISSSTVGWSILEYDDTSYSLLEYGNIKPPKSSTGSLAVRLSTYFDQISSLIKEKNPDCVAIESYANKFSKGKSSARTIIVLSVFNEMTSVAAIRSIKVEPKSYAVATIRSSLSKIFNKKISSKEEAFSLIEKNFPSFKIRHKRTGKIKDECYDESDAIAVSLTHFYKEKV